MKSWLAIIAVSLSALPAGAAESSDPEWPCIQRKVPHLSVGQMWAGPPITETDLDDWRSDPAVSALAPILAVRRTPEEEAERLIAEFAAAHREDRAEKLGLLFAGVFSLIERERTTIIAGIGRYARKQVALSQAIDETQTRLTALGAAAEKDLDLVEELEDRIHWDTRIYKDRAQSLTYVCETPVILERRAFAIARMIQAALD